MKEIKAFIRPNKVNDIIDHLKNAGFDNMTISMAEGAMNCLRDFEKYCAEKGIEEFKI